MGINEKFARNVRAILTAKDASVLAFESAIGVSAGYLSRLLRHDNDIAMVTAYRAAKTLGVSVEDLIEKDYVKETLVQEMQAEIDAHQREAERLKGELARILEEDNVLPGV